MSWDNPVPPVLGYLTGLFILTLTIALAGGLVYVLMG